MAKVTGISGLRRNPGVTRGLACALVAQLLAFPASVPAFNPVHSASYDLEPAGIGRTTWRLSLAGSVDARSTDRWDVPVSLALRVSPHAEFGAGLKTEWGGDGDHVPYLVFGVKLLARTGTSFQGDLLVPAVADRSKGFSLAALQRFRHASWVDSRLALRLGFMEALANHDALAAFEAAWYPAIRPGGPLALELGMIGSSQSRDFEGNLAMDIQPALDVAFRRNGAIKTAVAIGLAGNHKEQLRIKLQYDQGF